MVSKADVVNYGMTLIDEGAVTNTFDSNPVSETDRVCGLLYDRIRREMLRRDVWTFAKIYASWEGPLTPNHQWDNGFPLPGDFLRLVKLDAARAWTPIYGRDYELGVMINGDVKQRVLLTDYDSPLKLTYIFDAENPNLFDPLFINALGARIAEVAAPRLTDDDNAVTRAQTDLARTLSDAYAINAIEEPPTEITNSDFLTVRG